jgi:CheY-like chemotaxis protein
VRASDRRDGDGDYVRLSVIDSGLGMSDEVKQHVFEPFFTTKEVGKGSGLGLAQVYGFAKQSGGSVEIESELGRGTTVTLLLPRSIEPVESHPRQMMRLEVSEKEAQGCVLLVEDNDEVATLVREMLHELGYEVTRTASAEAALGALANGRRVDVVFSDIMMPGEMDGVDLGREIRARRRNLPVVLSSGFAEAALSRAEAEGFRVLPKPYGMAELAAALNAAMDEAGVPRSQLQIKL